MAEWKSSGWNILDMPQIVYSQSMSLLTNGKQFPFSYCVLPGKSHAVYLAYLQALELVKLKAKDIGFDPAVLRL